MLTSVLAAAAALVGMVHSHSIYVSGYNGTILPYTFTPPSTLQPSSASPPAAGIAGASPSWITFSASSRLLYVTDESTPGAIHALSVASDGTVSTFSQGVSTVGNGPVASTLAGDCIFVANYNSGSAAALPIKADGGLEADALTIRFTRNGTGPVTSRQNQSYAHDAVTSPDGKWVYVPDLGADVIHQLSSQCSSAISSVGSTTVPSGSGPRHIAFYVDDSGTYAYLASELACTLTAFAYEASSGALSTIGEPQLAVPEGVELGGSPSAGPQRTTSEVAVSPDGKFVYVGARGDSQSDHIVVYARAQDGSIAFQEWVETGGLNLRHFSLSTDEDAAYLVAGHQASGSIVVLARDKETGSLSATGAIASGLGQVAFAGFAPF